MLTIPIPGREDLQLAHLILDYNGTIALDGAVIESIRSRLDKLAESLSICVITADTHGTAAAACRDLPLHIRHLSFYDADDPYTCVFSTHPYLHSVPGVQVRAGKCGKSRQTNLV